MNNSCPVPAGTLVIIGGKENKGDDTPSNRQAPTGYVPLEILKKFVELLSRENPVVEVITTASGEGEESFSEYQKLFVDLGIKESGHIHHTTREQIADEESIDRIKKADGIFFAGGDQLLLASLYGGSRFLTELKTRYISENIVIGGTSAGAMALSTPMIYAGNAEVQQIGGAIKVTTGLEFLKDVCIDTHFVHRARFVRLAQVIATNPTCIGLGIEEDTAVVITEGTKAEVIGSGTVLVIKGFDIKETSIREFGNDRPLSIRNLIVDILAKDDLFEIPQVNPPHL
jgi:cyanophycinase